MTLSQLSLLDLKLLVYFYELLLSFELLTTELIKLFLKVSKFFLSLFQLLTDGSEIGLRSVVRIDFSLLIGFKKLLFFFELSDTSLKLLVSSLSLLSTSYSQLVSRLLGLKLCRSFSKLCSSFLFLALCCLDLLAESYDTFIETLLIGFELGDLLLSSLKICKALCMCSLEIAQTLLTFGNLSLVRRKVYIILLTRSN